MTAFLRVVYFCLRLGVELPLRGILLIYYLLVFLLIERPRWKSAASSRVHLAATQPTGLWCIFAIAQGRRVSQNLLAFLSCLKEAGYNVILVNNGDLSPEISSNFLPYCHSVIERPRGGRDFGGYKWGTQTLSKMDGEDHDIGQVIYCNDSIFVRPSALRQSLERLRQLDDDFIGVTETFSPVYHLQSWFFAVSGRLFADPAFQEYWQNYRPLSYRLHCIKHGEIGLSRYCIGMGITPRLLYTQGGVIDIMLHGSLSETVDRLLGALGPLEYETLRDKIQQITFAEAGENAPMRSFLRHYVTESLGRSNTMNAANLILLRETGFPFLKKDLVYRGQYLVTQIDEVVGEWVGEDAAYEREILGYFRARGSLRDLRSPTAMLARIGVI